MMTSKLPLDNRLVPPSVDPDDIGGLKSIYSFSVFARNLGQGTVHLQIARPRVGWVEPNLTGSSPDDGRLALTYLANSSQGLLRDLATTACLSLATTTFRGPAASVAFDCMKSGAYPNGYVPPSNFQDVDLTAPLACWIKQMDPNDPTNSKGWNCLAPAVIAYYLVTVPRDCIQQLTTFDLHFLGNPAYGPVRTELGGGGTPVSWVKVPDPTPWPGWGSRIFHTSFTLTPT
jgi:hypothetical protein